MSQHHQHHHSLYHHHCSCVEPFILATSSCGLMTLLIIVSFFFFVFFSNESHHQYNNILQIPNSISIPPLYNSYNGSINHTSLYPPSPTYRYSAFRKASDNHLSYNSSSLPPELMSLMRLERGLRRVRVGLQLINNKNLKKMETNDGSSRTLHESTGHDGDEHQFYPWGPIYKNAPLFQQSYTQMEKMFKVFVYPEGKQPLVHDGPCKDIYSTEGRFIHELRETNPFVTMDPYKAHVFFLPFSVSKMVSYLYEPESLDMSPLIHFVWDYVEVVGRRHPFWNRSKGADHFMLSCHDWGPHISRAHPHLENHAIRVLCNANSSEGFIPHKDASLPEINMVGGHIPKELGGFVMKERIYLAFFAGQDHGPVRPTLFKHWGGSKDKDMKVFHELTHVDVNETYQGFMKKSRFCLCPGGFEVNSPRIVEAIYYDCIPIIIADGFVLPFSDVLDWDAFSIQVKEKDIPQLKQILQDVPMAKCQEMQDRIRKVKRHFFFNKPPRRYDLFHMILHSVWLRRLNIRLKYDLYD